VEVNGLPVAVTTTPVTEAGYTLQVVPAVYAHPKDWTHGVTQVVVSIKPKDGRQER
jgi:hypothetical protein